MFQTITITPRRLIALTVLGLLAVVTYGFAAANTVPASVGGDGQSAVTGYAVSNVHYVLDTNNPSNVSSVTFTLTPGLASGGAARISINGGTSWLASCTSSGPGATSNISCAGPVAVTVLSNLRVVAAQ